MNRTGYYPETSHRMGEGCVAPFTGLMSSKIIIYIMCFLRRKVWYLTTLKLSYAI